MVRNIEEEIKSTRTELEQAAMDCSNKYVNTVPLSEETPPSWPLHSLEDMAKAQGKHDMLLQEYLELCTECYMFRKNLLKK
ncbi:hypothetical protein E3J79_03165 [Candidatus Dependentiae bacterium]|nr:MAG: hypothetical protein E3J79_03165 [Candidatus Dependentiae bacterium]